MALQDLTPQLRTRLSRTERAAGWFVFIAMALLVFGFGYYLYKTAERDGWFITRARYYTMVDTASGLKVGDPVILRGDEVGKITVIEQMPPYSQYNVYVEFEIRAPKFGYLWSEGSVAKVASSGFLDKRVIEVTKGTNGHALYTTHPLKTLSLQEAEDLSETNAWRLAEDLFEGTNLVVKTGTPLKKDAIGKIASLKQESFVAFDTSEDSKEITAYWDSSKSRYEIYNKADKPMGLPAVESPAVSQRLEAMANQVEQALPSILALTNQLALVLNNGVNLTSNLNAVAASMQPAASNLAALSAQLKGPGALGEWLVSTNFPQAVDTNMVALAMSLGDSLENLANITSNLNVQVQQNTNMLGSISKSVTDADDLVQGLKRHWFFRSAFKKKSETPSK